MSLLVLLQFMLGCVTLRFLKENAIDRNYNSVMIPQF